MATRSDVTLERVKLWAIVVTVVVGPFVSFWLSRSHSDANHAQTTTGYATITKVINAQSERLAQIELRLRSLEKQPSTQPIIIDRLIAARPAPRVADVKAPARAAAKAAAPRRAAKMGE